jgi:hypothetical protein
MAKATGQDVKALLLKARNVPNEPGSVHDVKPSNFLPKSVRSIWKYPDGLVFQPLIAGANLGLLTSAAIYIEFYPIEKCRPHYTNGRRSC